MFSAIGDGCAGASGASASRTPMRTATRGSPLARMSCDALVARHPVERLLDRLDVDDRLRRDRHQAVLADLRRAFVHDRGDEVAALRQHARLQHVVVARERLAVEEQHQRLLDELALRIGAHVRLQQRLVAGVARTARIDETDRGDHERSGLRRDRVCRRLGRRDRHRRGRGDFGNRRRGASVFAATTGLAGPRASSHHAPMPMSAIAATMAMAVAWPRAPTLCAPGRGRRASDRRDLRLRRDCRVRRRRIARRIADAHRCEIGHRRVGVARRCRAARRSAGMDRRA